VTFQATETFWRKFYDLPAAQKQSVREKWKIFHQNPFHPSLGTHKIHRLSALAKNTIYGVVIEKDLRAIFQIEGGLVTTLDIGTHDVYE